MIWEVRKLEDVTTKIGDGLHGTPKYNDNGDYYFINGNNFIQGKVQIKQETKRIDYDEYLKIKKELNQQTLFVAINGTLGNVALYNDENIALGKSACYLNVREDVSRSFIKYILEDENFQRYAELFATGATIKNLGLKAVREYSFSLPPLPTQKRIASILSNYDDLIENNLKRIKLLEETAQNIYKEWFVNFRFPNYENTPFNEETGLPVGWEMKKLSELVYLTMGQSPESEYYNINNEGLPFHQGVTGYGQRFVNHSTYCSKITRIAEEGDILFSVRAPVGRLNIAPDKLIIGRGLSAIKNKEGYQSFQFYQLKNHFYQEDMIGGGAIFNSVTKSDLENQLLIYPMYNLIVNFEKIVKPIDGQIWKLNIQNQKLKEARDILLPRLMNRTIEV